MRCWGVQATLNSVECFFLSEHYKLSLCSLANYKNAVGHQLVTDSLREELQMTKLNQIYRIENICHGLIEARA